MKLIKKVRQYQTKTGETKNAVQFYIVVEGQKPIAIDAHQYGDKGSTYNLLNWLAEYVK